MDFLKKNDTCAWTPNNVYAIHDVNPDSIPESRLLAAGLGTRATSNPRIKLLADGVKQPGDEQSCNPGCWQLVWVPGQRALLESRLLAAGPKYPGDEQS